MSNYGGYLGGYPFAGSRDRDRDGREIRYIEEYYVPVLEPEKFKVRNQFGFVEPKLYDKRQENLAKFIVKTGTKIREGALLKEEGVRRLWAGTFVSNTPEESNECMRMLREQVEMGIALGEGKKYLEEASGTGWRFMRPQHGVLEEMESKTGPLKRFEKEDVIVVSNLVGSLPTTPFVIKALDAITSKQTPYVLAGTSKNGETLFEDGKSMIGEFFVHPSELKTLMANTQRVAIVVDDSEISGKTYKVMRESLKKIGYTRIFKLATHDAELLDEKGKSLNGPKTYSRFGNLGGLPGIDALLDRRDYGERHWSPRKRHEGKKIVAIIGGESGYKPGARLINRGAWWRALQLARALGSELAKEDYEIGEKEHHQGVSSLTSAITDEILTRRGPGNSIRRGETILNEADAVIVAGWNENKTPKELMEAVADGKVIGVLEDSGVNKREINYIVEDWTMWRLGAECKIFFSADPALLVRKMGMAFAVQDGELPLRKERRDGRTEEKKTIESESVNPSEEFWRKLDRDAQDGAEVRRAEEGSEGKTPPKTAKIDGKIIKL